MINFSEEFKDIVDVSKVQCFCFGFKDEISPKKLTFAGGGSKFSRLCGFKFYSKVNPKYKNGEFMIVFCAKLRSKIYHQANQNPSQWFAFLKTEKQTIEVLDKRFCMLAFDFDVDKFFDTDIFAHAVKRFDSHIKNGLAKANQMISNLNKEEAEGHTEYEYLPRYVKAISEALPLIGNPKFNDKKYTLTMNFEDPRSKYDKKNKEFDSGKFADFIKRDQEMSKVKKVLRTGDDY